MDPKTNGASLAYYQGMQGEAKVYNIELQKANNIKELSDSLSDLSDTFMYMTTHNDKNFDELKEMITNSKYDNCNDEDNHTIINNTFNITIQVAPETNTKDIEHVIERITNISKNTEPNDSIQPNNKRKSNKKKRRR
jgi:predicted O-linked N-acetylglucosamine transferase (SPINDLY family)